ncbi:MAG: hypothetical protein Q8K64_01770 [Sediminibacterium sp.]|nr:MAG: hypothetical protein FD183_964 [Chitinophagaceae bacterium]MDP1842118.1 hypothetical protein [Sediminibacterium sp.]
MKKLLHKFFILHWDAFIASIVASVLVCLFTNHSGIGISPDSVQYLSVANHIVERFSFTDFNNQPFVLFPLGYPIFLALIKAVGQISITTFLPVANSFIFSALLFACSSILKAAIKLNGFFRLLVLLLLACSPALLEVYTMLWSETLFILISLVFVFASKKYINQSTIRSLLFLAFVAAMGFFVRYVGVVFILTSCLFILFNPQLQIKQKIIHWLLIGSIGSSLVIINLARNAMVSGTYTGVREKAIRTFWDNVQDAGIVIDYWFPVPANFPHLAIIILLLFFILALGYFIKAIVQSQYIDRYPTIVAVFILVYTLFMFSIASVSRFETLSSRLLSPLFIPMILLLAFWVNQLITRNTKTIRALIAFISILVYSLIQLHQYNTNQYTWEGVGYAGIPGYSEDQWTKSPMVAYIKKDIEKYQPPVLANANDALYYLAGINSVALPHKDIPTEIEQFKQIQHFYLIWFFYGENDDLIDLTYILQQKKPVASWQFKDGIIYRF